jgi:hypothetical protein
MGFRRGIVLGLAVGSAIAAAINRPKRAEAPGLAGGEEAAVSGVTGFVQRLKRQADEALQAAREAQSEEEARLRREFEDTKRGRG